MAPVRELAQQIQLEAEKFGAPVGIKSVCVYGGAPKAGSARSRGRPPSSSAPRPPQRPARPLQPARLQPRQLLLPGPGRGRSDARHGVEPQIVGGGAASTSRQTLTATWPREVRGMAPRTSRRAPPRSSSAAPTTSWLPPRRSRKSLRRWRRRGQSEAGDDDAAGRAKIAVFCNTKASCAKLPRSGGSGGTCAIHGDKEQWERAVAQGVHVGSDADHVRDGRRRARPGIKGVQLVINFDLPQGERRGYVHRIGRTGRARGGEAVSSSTSAPTRSARPSLRLVREAGQEVPDFLRSCAASTRRPLGRGGGAAARAAARAAAARARARAAARAAATAARAAAAVAAAAGASGERAQTRAARAPPSPPRRAARARASERAAYMIPAAAPQLPLPPIRDTYNRGVVLWVASAGDWGISGVHRRRGRPPSCSACPLPQMPVADVAVARCFSADIVSRARSPRARSDARGVLL